MTMMMTMMTMMTKMMTMMMMTMMMTMIQIQIRRRKRVATQTSTARQRGRTNLKAAPHLMAPVTENHKARLHGGLVQSVIPQTSVTAASTLPLNSLSDCTSTKKLSEAVSASCRAGNEGYAAKRRGRK